MDVVDVLGLISDCASLRISFITFVINTTQIIYLVVIVAIALELHDRFSPCNFKLALF